MSEPDDLKRKLSALANADVTFGAKGRIISEGGLPTPVQAILQEVSETALAQDLTFYIGEAGSLVLVVSGRRILAVRAVEGLVMPAVAEQLAGKPLSPTPDAAQRALMALLMQIDLMQDMVETTSADGPAFAAPPDAGLSPERVAALAGIPYPVTTPGPMDRLIAALPTPPTCALVIRAEEAPVETGAAADIARLQALSHSLGVGDNQATGAAKLSIFGQQSGQAPFIGAAIDKTDAALWTMQTQDVGAAIRAFHKIFGSRAQ